MEVRSQPANYVNNGGFEEAVSNTNIPSPWPTYWGATDSSKVFGELLGTNTTPPTAPLCSYTYQWPHGGSNHLISLQFCPTCPSNKRGYPRNRLKQVLNPNTTYCFSMYVNLSNQSTHAIDALGAYFGDSDLDTITKCNTTIDYLNPQVQNSTNNIISDTLRWILVRGEFVANGTEKYVMIGNFKHDSLTNKILVNATNLPANAASYLIDDVSLIESDLPAFAGNDTLIFLGDSVFLGREPDVGINDACVWYKMPNTTNPIDTIAGFWIKPTSTETYVVRQEICGNIKWDTVVVKPVLFVGIENSLLNQNVELFPNPAGNFINLRSGTDLSKVFDRIEIYDNVGQRVREENFEFRIKTENLSEGVYLLKLSGASGSICKRLVISR